MCFVGVVPRVGNGLFLRFPPSGLDRWDFRFGSAFVGPVIIVGFRGKDVGYDNQIFWPWCCPASRQTTVSG